MDPKVGASGYSHKSTSNWTTKTQNMNLNPEKFQLHEKDKNKDLSHVSIWLNNAAFGA